MQTSTENQFEPELNSVQLGFLKSVSVDTISSSSTDKHLQ